eukprot:13035225-Alexandrium_andersonii.AAC.1
MPPAEGGGWASAQREGSPARESLDGDEPPQESGSQGVSVTSGLEQVRAQVAPPVSSAGGEVSIAMHQA